MSKFLGVLLFRNRRQTGMHLGNTRYIPPETVTPPSKGPSAHFRVTPQESEEVQAPHNQSARHAMGGCGGHESELKGCPSSGRLDREVLNGVSVAA